MSTGRWVDGEWQGSGAGEIDGGAYDEGRYVLHCAAPLPEEDPPSQWEIGAFGVIGEGFRLQPFWSICREFGIEVPRLTRTDGCDHT